MNRGDSAVARGFFEEALSVARTLPDPGDYSPFVHASFGQAAMFDGDLGQAREWFEAGLAALSSDEHQLRPMLLGNLAWVVKELGDPRRAAVLEREALIADRALGSLPFAAEHLESIAEHAASARRWETAA
jgi:hypothetical protein